MHNFFQLKLKMLNLKIKKQKFDVLLALLGELFLSKICQSHKIVYTCIFPTKAKS